MTSSLSLAHQGTACADACFSPKRVTPPQGENVRDLVPAENSQRRPKGPPHCTVQARATDGARGHSAARCTNCHVGLKADGRSKETQAVSASASASSASVLVVTQRIQRQAVFEGRGIPTDESVGLKSPPSSRKHEESVQPSSGSAQQESPST